MKEVEISGAYFSQEHFLQAYTTEQLAHMWCVLNSWETPGEFQMGRKLTKEEVRKVFSVLSPVVPRKDRMAAWKEWIKREKT